MPWTEGEVIANGYGAFWWEGVIDENVLKLIEAIVVQFFEYIKKKPTELFSWSRWVIWYVDYIWIKLLFKRANKVINLQEPQAMVPL